MTILVSEIGINWNSDYELAHKMMQESIECGADYVKIQMRSPEVCVPKDQWYKPKLTPWGETIDYISYRHRMEFTDDQLKGFSKYPWFPSVFDVESLERAIRFRPPFIKIPSCAITDSSLLEAAIETGIPLITSTGMSTKHEVIHLIGALESARQEVWILHCNSSYPTKDEEVNLSAIKTLKKLAPFARIGFSSHSVSPLVPVASIYFGAEMIEAHFTTDRSLPGGDMSASLEPAGLALISREIERSKKIIGDGQIRLYDSELEPRAKLRGS